MGNVKQLKSMKTVAGVEKLPSIFRELLDSEKDLEKRTSKMIHAVELNGRMQQIQAIKGWERDAKLRDEHEILWEKLNSMLYHDVMPG